MIVSENCGSLYFGVGEVTLIKTQLIKSAEHTVGNFATELASGDFLAAGKRGIMECGGNEIAYMHIPCTGDYLNGLSLTCVNTANPHMVGIGVLFHGQDLTDNDVAYLCTEILVSLDL